MSNQHMTKNDNDFITKEEMIELTGHYFKSKQCESLRRAGIFFIERPDGHPRTTWGHFNNPLKHRETPPTSSEPDWGAME